MVSKLYKGEFGRLTKKEIVFLFIATWEPFNLPILFSRKECNQLAKRLLEKEEITKEKYKDIMQDTKQAFKEYKELLEVIKERKIYKLKM